MVRAPEILESSVFELPVSKVSCGWKHTAVISGVVIILPFHQYVGFNW